MSSGDPKPAEHVELPPVVFAFPEVLEPGVYAATLAGVRAFTFTREGEDVTLWAWTFAVPSSGEDPVIVEGVSSPLLTPRSKGLAWLTALAPEIVASRDRIAAADLVGRPCMVVVEADAQGYAKVGDVVAAPRKGKG